MLTQALIIALAASADAAYLRASSEGRRLAGHGGHDDGDCHDDPEWRVGGVLNRALDASTASRTKRRSPAHDAGTTRTAAPTTTARGLQGSQTRAARLRASRRVEIKQCVDVDATIQPERAVNN